MSPPNIAERLAQEVDVIDEKTRAALSQIGREEKAAAADEVSPIVRHRASMVRPKVMSFAEPIIGPAAPGRTRWLKPSYGLGLQRASVCSPTSRVRSTHSKARPARLDSFAGYRWGCTCNGARSLRDSARQGLLPGQPRHVRNIRASYPSSATSVRAVPRTWDRIPQRSCS